MPSRRFSRTLEEWKYISRPTLKRGSSKWPLPMARTPATGERHCCPHARKSGPLRRRSANRHRTSRPWRVCRAQRRAEPDRPAVSLVRLIRWTTEASDQLEAAVKRIQQDNPTAARNVAQAVIDRIEQLATFPRPWPTRRSERNPRTRQPALRCCVPFHRRNCRNPVHLARGAGLAMTPPCF